jgi:outer membrane protein assembly factor BamA
MYKIINLVILITAFEYTGISLVYSQDKDSLVTENSIFEPLPIISYDTDTGLGYGVKAFFLNFLDRHESFDVILFNSTKGERWYRFIFSIPDFELRQGKKYPLAFDLIIDYDKWIAYHFYGIGNRSDYDDEEKYTRTFIEINMTASRGFSEQLISQIKLSYKSIDNSQIQIDKNLMRLQPDLNRSSVKFLSTLFKIRYDTRNSFINPSIGTVCEASVEYAPDIFNNDVSFTLWSAWIQYYSRLFINNLILAVRFGLQTITADGLPIQVLLPLGGNKTLRGYPQDRFLDQSTALLNAEVRFPLYKRLGAIIGLDTGKVFPSLRHFNLVNLHSNSTFGLRYYFQTFIVRLDLGISPETFGLYLNFGHVF